MPTPYRIHIIPLEIHKVSNCLAAGMKVRVWLITQPLHSRYILLLISMSLMNCSVPGKIAHVTAVILL